MNRGKTAFSLKNFSVTAALTALTFIGTAAISTTGVVTTAAVLSITYSSTALAFLICRGEPIDTRYLKQPKEGQYFYYQPMKKGGLFGRCKKIGSIRKVRMSIPHLPKVFKLKRGGLSRLARNSDGCSAGGLHGKRLFHAACVAHDVCYTTLGVAKLRCDDLFLSNMLKISKHGPLSSRVTALSWTAGVGIAAKSRYRAGQSWARAQYTNG